MPNGNCVSSQGIWRNLAITQYQGIFSVEFDVVPASPAIDGTVGLSDGPVTLWSKMAAIVRFNNLGRIDARNGSVYSAQSQIQYSAGQTYNVKVVVNLITRKYSVLVNGQPLATDYSFRSEQSNAQRLNNVAVFSSIGSITVCDIKVLPPVDDIPPVVTLNPVQTPVSAVTSVTAVATDNQEVAGVQLKVDGVAVGPEDTTGPYVFSLDTTDLSDGEHTISVVARDKAGNLSQESSTMIVVDNTPPQITNVQAKTDVVRISFVTNEPAYSTVEWGLTTEYGSFRTLGELNTQHSYAIEGLLPGTTYHYRVFASDEAGNLVTGEDKTFTTAGAAPISGVFNDTFDRPDGLITNEYAFWNPTAPDRVESPNWAVTSGSFFSQGNAGWTGIPDTKGPNAQSSNGTNSAIFRMITKKQDFDNVEVSLRLLNQGLVTTPLTPAVAWDGVHIFLRYQSEFSLYYASVNRRDNKIIIKKKVPGGPSNDGTYYDIGTPGTFNVPYGTWVNIKAQIRTNQNGSVTIRIIINDTVLLERTDSGTGGAPITSPGRVGIRGDNANLKFEDFAVNALP